MHAGRVPGSPYTVGVCLQGKGDLQLLHNITGTFRPGVLTALMGVSGEQAVQPPTTNNQATTIAEAACINRLLCAAA